MSAYVYQLAAVLFYFYISTAESERFGYAPNVKMSRVIKNRDPNEMGL